LKRTHTLFPINLLWNHTKKHSRKANNKGGILVRPICGGRKRSNKKTQEKSRNPTLKGTVTGQLEKREHW